MMKRMFALACLLASAQGHAQMTDEDMCRNGGFPSDQAGLRLMRFEAPAGVKLFFHGDMDGCPGRGDACRSSGYIVPGDELLVNKTHGGWSCAWFAGARHETVGWVPNAQLVAVPADAHPAWDGTWKEYRAPGYIAVARKGGAYYVTANTKWRGGYLPNGEPIEHLGSMMGELKVDGVHAHYGATGPLSQGWDCRADFVRIGRFLVAHDNAQCGGLNVRFDGVYTLAQPAPAGGRHAAGG